MVENGIIEIHTGTKGDTFIGVALINIRMGWSTRSLIGLLYNTEFRELHILILFLEIKVTLT